jgi:hypothetical protein
MIDWTSPKLWLVIAVAIVIILFLAIALKMIQGKKY